MSVDLFKEFATDLVTEEAGAWEEYADGVAFLIAQPTTRSTTGS